MTDTISTWRQESIDRDSRTDAMGAAIAALIGGTYSRGDDHTSGGIELGDVSIMLTPRAWGAKIGAWTFQAYVAGDYRVTMGTTKTLFEAGAGKEATAERIAKRIKSELAKPATVALIAQCAEVSAAKKVARTGFAAAIAELKAAIPRVVVEWDGKSSYAKVYLSGPGGSAHGDMSETGTISFQHVRPNTAEAALAVLAALATA